MATFEGVQIEDNFFAVLYRVFTEVTIKLNYLFVQLTFLYLYNNVNYCCLFHGLCSVFFVICCLLVIIMKSIQTKYDQHKQEIHRYDINPNESERNCLLCK